MLVFLWRKALLGDPRLHAPLLVTTILVVGDAAFGILEAHTAPAWLIRLTGGLVTTYAPTFLALYVRYLARFGLTLPEGSYRRYIGDAAVPGKGEILVWSGAA